MIVMIHDKDSNNFYLSTAGLQMIKGLEHGDVDSMIFVKALLRETKPLDLTAPLPRLHIQKLYQIDLSTVSADIEMDKTGDPEPWEIPTTIR